MTDLTAPAPAAAAVPFEGRTAWIRSLEAPVREFLRTETGGSAVLVGATVLALLWANIDYSSYEKVWTTNLTIRLGGSGISMDLRQWVNVGLMTLFFLVVGLEARREFDLGELRDRRRLALPAAGHRRPGRGARRRRARGCRRRDGGPSAGAAAAQPPDPG